MRPDILLLQEFDYDAAGESLRAFQSNYLARAQNGFTPLEYGYSFLAESNTGVPSGFDLDNDGRISGGGDALGFGEFPGQYAMAVLSRFPIETKRARTFRKFLWRDMPGALLPPGWYSARTARRAAAVLEEPLGRAGTHRSGHAAPAGEPSDAARFRRRRGSQWPAQP